MERIFDLDKLKQVMTLFCDVTNITITLFDLDLTPIMDVGEWKKYCLEIGKDETRLEKCRECNRKYAKLSAKSQEPLIYSCHAGIGEAVAPIYVDGVAVGYLMIGKFRDEEGMYSSEESVAAAAEAYDLNKEEMLSMWKELQLLDKKGLTSAILLLKIFLHYICDEKLIRAIENSFTEQIKDYINKHIGEKITIDNMGRDLHIAYHELYALFKKNFGKVPHDYIDEVRFQTAKDLLVNSKMPIQEIASKLGFNKSSVFSQFFKEKCGMGVTPLQYRKQNRQ